MLIITVLSRVQPGEVTLGNKNEITGARTQVSSENPDVIRTFRSSKKKSSNFA